MEHLANEHYYTIWMECYLVSWEVASPSDFVDKLLLWLCKIFLIWAEHLAGTGMPFAWTFTYKKITSKLRHWVFWEMAKHNFGQFSGGRSGHSWELSFNSLAKTNFQTLKGFAKHIKVIKFPTPPPVPIKVSQLDKFSMGLLSFVLGRYQNQFGYRDDIWSPERGWNRK